MTKLKTPKTVSLSAFKVELLNKTINLVLASANVTTLNATIKIVQTIEEEEEIRMGNQKLDD